MGIKNVKMKNMFFDPNKYLGERDNSLKIYDLPPRNLILSPFNMRFDSIERLLVLNLEDDPVYFRIELQILNKLDKMYPLVILYRKDNMMDIYYTNEALLKNRKKEFTDSFVNVSFNQVEAIDFKFQFDDTGLEAYIFFEDKLEKEIEFKIKENIPGRKLSSILAPMGAISNKPKYFPIVFLKEFGMVIKRNTEISIRIHGVLRNTTELPFQINGMNVYASHYSLNPMISNWNYNFSDDIDPIILNTPSLNISEKNIIFSLKNNFGYYEIKKISGKDEKGHTISFEFSPAIPNLISLKNNSKIKGRFSCTIDKQEGIFGGLYYINRTGETIEINITPKKGWQPFFGKSWLKSYKWTSKIGVLEKGEYKISSYWRRILR